jgi:hypothetical protein
MSDLLMLQKVTQRVMQRALLKTVVQEERSWRSPSNR